MPHPETPQFETTQPQKEQLSPERRKEFSDRMAEIEKLGEEAEQTQDLEKLRIVKELIAKTRQEYLGEIELSEEKKEEYRKLIDQAELLYSIVGMWPVNEIRQNLRHRFSHEDYQEVEKLLRKFQEEGETFTDFLIGEMDQELKGVSTHGFYKKLSIFRNLFSKKSKAALVRWLANEKIWNNHDSSRANLIIEEIQNRIAKEGIPELEIYIRNISQAGYVRADLRTHDFYSAAKAIIKIGGKDGFKRLDNLAQQIPVFSEWLSGQRKDLESLEDKSFAS